MKKKRFLELPWLCRQLKMWPIGTSGSVTGGSSGSFEQLGFEKKVKLNHLIFLDWLK